MATTLTILQPHGSNPVARKRFSLQGTEIVEDRLAHHARDHTVLEESVRSIADVAEVLSRHSSPDADPAFAIHGRLRSGRSKTKTRRTHIGENAAFEDAGTRIAFFDFDGLPEPEGLDTLEGASRAEAIIASLRQRLPHAFQVACCYWYFTGSMGLKPGVRARLVFMLDRSIAVADLKTWITPTAETLRDGKARRLDPSIYSPTQPVYFQPPIFSDGAVDPLIVIGLPRAGLLSGEPSVRVALGDIELARQDISATARSGAAIMSGTYEDHLASIDSAGEIHEPMRQAINAYFRTSTEGDGRSPEHLAGLLSAHLCSLTTTHDHPRNYLEKHAGNALQWCRNTLAIFEQRRAEEGWKRAGSVMRYPTKGGTLEEATDLLAEGFNTLSEVLNRRRPVVAQIGHPLAQAAITAIEAQPSKVKLSPANAADDAGLVLLREAFDEWTALAPDLAPAVLKITAGGGKSYAAADFAIERALAGDRVVLAVPTHEKARETVNDLDRASIKHPKSDKRIVAAVWRGVDQPSPETGGSMCLDHDRMRAGLDAGLARDHVCGQGRNRCSFFERCAYRAQGSRDPLVWVVTHAQLAFSPPNGLEAPDVLIIDESLSFDGQPLEVTTGLLSELAAESGNEPFGIKFKQLAKQFDSEPDGEISRDTLNGITRTHIGAIRHGLLRLQPTVAAAFEASRAGGRLLEEIGARRASILAADRVLRMLSDFLLTGSSRCERLMLVSTGAERRLRVWDYRPLHPVWRRSLLINLDATPSLEILQAVLGADTRILVDARIEAQAAIVSQTIDYSGSYTSLGKNRDWAEAERFERAIKNIAADLDEANGRQGRPKIGVVAPKELIETMRPWFPTSSVADFVFGHFGAIRGLNSMSDVDALIVVGRPQPSWSALDDLSRTIFGAGIPRQMVERYVELRASGNAPVVVKEQAFGDVQSDAVLWSKRDAEIEQAIGRARAVRRKASVHIYVLNSVPLDTTIGRAIDIASILERDSSRERAMAIDGLMFVESPARAAAYPHRYGSGKAAQKKKERGRGMCDTPLYRDIIRTSRTFEPPESAFLAKVRKGANRKLWKVFVDPRSASDLATLQRVLDRQAASTDQGVRLLAESFEASKASYKIDASTVPRIAASLPIDLSPVPISAAENFARSHGVDVDGSIYELMDIARAAGGVEVFFGPNAQTSVSLRAHRGRGGPGSRGGDL